MELLAPPPPAELPAETLLARLRCRRAGIDPSGSSGTSSWPGDSLEWLLPRLDRRLRHRLTPYLDVIAMHVLLVALRYRLSGGLPPQALLRQPWLSPALAPLLDQPGDTRAVTAAVEKWLTPGYPFASGMTRGYLDQGPGWVEQQLNSGMLLHSLSRAREPVVRMTLRYLVDGRNLLAVLRHWRWGLRIPPPLVPGGELDTALLNRAWAGRDQQTLGRMSSRLTGNAVTDFEPRAAERQLFTGLSSRLLRAGHDPLGVGVIIDSLWRSQVAARNRALQQAADGEDGLLAAALL